MPKGGNRPACNVPDCNKPHLAKGFCQRHYKRWRSTGDPDGGRTIEQGRNRLDKATKKFLRGLHKLKSGCWSCYTAYKTSAGYLHLQITEDGVQYAFRVHRFSYEHFVRKVPDDKLVLHKCDNRWCCNPSHLFVGTQSDNVSDMVAKGRHSRTGPKLSEAYVILIHRDLALGISKSDVAAKYGVTYNTVGCIARGVTWKHLYGRRRK